MKSKSFIIAIISLLTLCLCSQGFSLVEDTHKVINEHIAQKTMNDFSLHDYLVNLGFRDGIKEVLKGIDADKYVSQKIFWWLGYGGEQEDRPGSTRDYIQNRETRSLNHFHNPLMPWSIAGLNDNFLGQRTGQSSVLWAQNPNQHVGGTFAWSDARRYFYIALTGRNTDGTLIAPNKTDRDKYFAYTFRAVGQLMHLIQDASVPEHVRNDIHIVPAYEAYVNKIRQKNSSLWGGWIGSPITFDRSILNIPSTDTSAMVPISRIVDTDRYKFSNPEITKTLPGSPQTIGIAEYTNANFLSKDTMFDSDPTHHFENPQITDTVKWSDSNNRTYIRKVGDGDIVDHLAVTSILYLYRERYFSQFNESLPVSLDVECYKDYAQRLIPRAVGYSAGLLNYFFRGDIRLEYVTSPEPGYLIINNSGEKMEGDFTIYYDSVKDMRFPVWAGKGTLEAAIGDKTNTFDFIPPRDAKEPGKYILAFKGQMGNEQNAVAGYVFQRTLEITPPEQYVYSMIEGTGNPLQFTQIKAKVRNATSEEIQSGVFYALAKYKTSTTQEHFSYSVSASRTISSLSAASAEFTFDFSGNPIPVSISDLSLQIIFKGRIGGEENAVAIGIKDISEPTPIDLFNNMDKVCLYGDWHNAGSPEAIAQVDTNHNGIAEEADVYSHEVRDIYIKIAPAGTSEIATTSDYQYTFPSLSAGSFKRVLYILTDYTFNYSFLNKWGPGDPQNTNEPFTHYDESFLFTGTAVKNQTELISDPLVCGTEPPCYISPYPVFYHLRGIDMWWGGGLIYVNIPYPKDSECEWAELGQ